jgi:hypothetical protein
VEENGKGILVVGANCQLFLPFIILEFFILLSKLNVTHKKFEKKSIKI